MIAETSKVAHKFNNSAERFGFIAAFNELKQTLLANRQAQINFDKMLEELGIDRFDINKVYNVTEQNELLEVDQI